MKSLISILIFFTLSYLAANGQSGQQVEQNTYQVVGTVFDQSDKKPLQEAWVVAYIVEGESASGREFALAGEQYQAITDKKGRFVMTLSGENAYFISCIKEGYQVKGMVEFSQKQISAGQSISIQIPMEISNAGTVLFGRASLEENGQSLSGASITLIDENNNQKLRFLTDASGSYRFYLHSDHTYSLLGNKPHYFGVTHENVAANVQGGGTLELNLAFSKIRIGQKMVFNSFFNVNDFRVTKAGESILSEVISLLKSNPTINIEVSCHTDSRGDDKYNLELSEKQALSIVDFLTEAGIASDRMYGKGYGEEKLLNECSNGVKCANASHAENRRIEVVIVSIIE